MRDTSINRNNYIQEYTTSHLPTYTADNIHGRTEIKAEILDSNHLQFLQANPSGATHRWRRLASTSTRQPTELPEDQSSKISRER